MEDFFTEIIKAFSNQWWELVINYWHSGNEIASYLPEITRAIYVALSLGMLLGLTHKWSDGKNFRNLVPLIFFLSLTVCLFLYRYKILIDLLNMASANMDYNNKEITIAQIALFCVIGGIIMAFMFKTYLKLGSILIWGSLGLSMLFSALFDSWVPDWPNVLVNLFWLFIMWIINVMLNRTSN